MMTPEMAEDAGVAEGSLMVLYLKDGGASTEIWAVVRNQLPDYLKSKEWLKHAGGLLEASS